MFDTVCSQTDRLNTSLAGRYRIELICKVAAHSCRGGSLHVLPNNLASARKRTSPSDVPTGRFNGLGRDGS
jgi:hypothetical protein